MDFQPSETRRLLADSLGRYLADHYPISQRNAVAYSDPWHDPGKWSEMAELGVLHALVPEALGGMGGDGFDIATVFEALGAALCPEPVLGALCAARLIGAVGGDLEPLLSGRVRYAVGFDGDVSANGDTLTGRKSVIYGGASADRILVICNRNGLFELDANSVERTCYGMIDGGNAAEVFLDNTPATRLASDAGELVQGAREAAALALCAEALGAMDVSFAMLKDYLATRQQFGRVIGSFQAIQHRMVELLGEIEQARSITILAASRMDTAEQSRSVAMAKSLVGRVAQKMAEELIQLHGGIAMTWEHPASHYAKRLVMIDHQFGDTDHHLMRVMAAY